MVTGARAVMEDLGIKLDSITLDDLGTAERVVVTKDHTVIVGHVVEAHVADDCAPLLYYRRSYRSLTDPTADDARLHD